MPPPGQMFSRNTNGTPKPFLVQPAMSLPESHDDGFTLPRLNRRNALLALAALPILIAAHLILEHVFHL